MAPPHLLGVDVVHSTGVSVHNVGRVEYKVVDELIHPIRTNGTDERHQDVWLLCPGVFHSIVGREFVLKQQFFPHVGTEDLSMGLSQLHVDTVNVGSMTNFMYHLTNMFSLNGYIMKL